MSTFWLMVTAIPDSDFNVVDTVSTPPLIAVIV